MSGETNDRALDLLRRMMDVLPWHWSDPVGIECIFCRCTDPPHAADCLYAEAVELLESGQGEEFVEKQKE